MNYKSSEMSDNFLIGFYLNDRKEHMINNTSLNKNETCINKILQINSTYIIETEINHWVTVTITENCLFYIEKRECEICLSNKFITQFAFKNNLDITLQKWDTAASDCLIYPLFFTLQMLRGNSATEPTELLINLYSLNKFREEFNTCKSQFEKIKEKIKVCSNLFLEIKDEMPIITDYKHALYFIYFVESVGLQDVWLKNDELKKYIIQTVISEKNVEIVKKIRFWLLHREKGYFIFPQQLQKFTFQETDSRKIFGDLQIYLTYVYHKLCGEEEDEPENQPFSMLCHSEDLGNKLGDENVSHTLEDLSYQFIKEGFSLKKSKNPEKTLFNLIANFIPLLRLVYKVERETFKSLIDFRNQLIHNNYILYQNGKEVPYIACQNRLYQVKEFLLKFNFCSKITRELEAISITDGLQKSIGKLNECLQRFKNLFSEELKSLTEKDSPEDEEKELNYLIEKIEQYFRSLFIVDTFNSITISNIEIEKFDLPKIYYRFSEENKNFMFKKFNIVKEINECKDLSEGVRKDIEEIIKHELKSSGLNELEYKRICRSVLNPQYFDNEKLIKEIQEHILNIKKLKNKSEFDMKVIINDYYMYLKNDPEFSFEKYKKITTLEKFTDKAFEISIIDGSFYMCLSDILRNFIPLYFNISPNYKSFETVESIFQDQVVLHIISCSSLDKKKITRMNNNLALLAPLGIEILYNQKVMLEIDEERDFVVRLMQNLLKSEFSDEFLHKLISLCKIKDRKLIEDCFDSLLKRNLIRKRPEKLQVLFSIPVFQDILFKILKSDQIERGKIFILIEFLKYQYKKANDLCQQKNYVEAFELVNRKLVGLSPFLKEVVDRRILPDEFLVYKIKYLIGKITFQNGIKLHEKGSEGKENKHFENSIKILEALLCKLPNSNFGKHGNIRWELCIKVLRARIYHCLGRCEESSNEYRYIFLKLYSICDSMNLEKVKELFLDEFGFIKPKNNKMGNKIKSLIKSRRYKSVTKLNKRNLNISQILRNYCSELHCWMKQLRKHKDIFDQCTGAISSCNSIIGILMQILNKKNYIIKNTTFTTVKLYRLLRAKPVVIKIPYSKKIRRNFVMNLQKPVKKQGS